MKGLVVVLALLLCGCEHMYGAVDVGMSDEDAIRIARADAARRGVSLEGLSPTVGRFDSGTSVSFRPPECVQGGCLDGLPSLFFIPAGERRVTHFQDGSV